MGPEPSEDDPPVPDLAAAREAYERAAGWVRPTEVVGTALNTFGMAEDQARAACEAAERSLGLPATDPVRFGAGPIADVLLEPLSRRPPAGGRPREGIA